jgi:two-component system sensor histidine kinase/response regulator
VGIWESGQWSTLLNDGAHPLISKLLGISAIIVITTGTISCVVKGLIMSKNKAIRVLVAEDDALVGEMVQGIVEAVGYTVIGLAANGQELIEMAQCLKPDLIVTDILMPDMDGLDAARQIQSCRPTPIVVLSAFETPELIERASQAGVGAYLLKPPDIGEVERAIALALARFSDMMELRKLNAELDAYAHTVAHDLKNPLSGVISCADYLVREHNNLAQEDVQYFLKIIAKSSHKMYDIIEDLLMMTETRYLQVRLSPLDMADIVQEAQNSLAWMIREYKAELVLPDRWPTALGCDSWIEGVWVNYISNGIRYGGHPPLLELGGEELPDGKVRFWVKDNGPGISPEDQRELFVPFMQLERKQREGHGLGLSIVQRVIEKLEGQAGVQSEPGQGSTFYFTLKAANN